MKSILIVLLLIVAVGAFLLRKRRARGAQAGGRQQGLELTKTSEFHAVSIRPKADACAAAKALAGYRFLASEAPHLPLTNCDAANCDCQFTHYADRRSGRERRSPFSTGRFGATTGKFDTERRLTPDRRHNGSGSRV